MMVIREYHALDVSDQRRAREAISTGEWRAASYLHALLEADQLRERYGGDTRLLLGMEGEHLTAFCTLAERDEIADTDAAPWIGFVYTFPAFRGGHRAGMLIDRACALAKEAGFDRVYVSTDHVGLYEKYGFGFLNMDVSIHGEETRVYCREL